MERQGIGPEIRHVNRDLVTRLHLITESQRLSIMETLIVPNKPLAFTDLRKVTDIPQGSFPGVIRQLSNAELVTAGPYELTRWGRGLVEALFSLEDQMMSVLMEDKIEEIRAGLSPVRASLLERFSEEELENMIRAQAEQAIRNPQQKEV